VGQPVNRGSPAYREKTNAPTADNVMHSIMLAVPASMHRQVFENRPPLRATAVLVPWAAGSGIGLLVVAAAADAVLAVVDIAGRADLAELQVAARQGKLTAGISSDADPAVTPLLTVAGFADAVSDARSLRRLSARELVEAVVEVRSILRGPAAHALLGMPVTVTRLDTLTVNCCPL
jgi:hypothetical protein